MKNRVHEVVAGLLIGLLAAAVIIGTDELFSRLEGGTAVNPLQTLEMQTYDWRLSTTAQPATARKDIALIEIDEFSLRNLEPYAGRWPWPRLIHATLLDYLIRAKTKVIVYDVNFAEPDDKRLLFSYGEDKWTGANSDKELVKSVKKAGNVIMLADATYAVDATAQAASKSDTPLIPDEGFKLDVPGIRERDVVFPPFPELRDAVSGFGHNLFVIDQDGPLRHMTPFVRTHHRALPSLGVAGALRAANIKPQDVRLEGDALVIGDRLMPLTERSIRSAEGVTTYKWELLNFRGPALLADLVTRPYASYHFWDLWMSEQQLLGGAKPEVDPSVFKDKIVFVGVTAAGLYDVFETPVGGGKMPGIMVHATIADDILSKRFVTPASTGVWLTTVIASAIAMGLVSTLIPAWWATAVTLVFLAGLTLVSRQLFAGGYWLNLSQPALASTLSLFGGVGYQYFVEGREKRKMKKLFGQYVSKDVYDHLVSNPQLARLGGARREMTVLFSDIRGFTSVSERGEPEEIVHTLNEYFTRMVDLVFKHQGTLDKFVGDMVMALFGAPLADRDHADHAVETAMEMIVELRKLNEGWREQGRPQLDIGIGINTGPMIAGNIGSEAIMSYTVIGDAVNLGSRLESLNKNYGTRIIISEGTREHLKNKYVFRPLGDVVVKGKTKPVAIFEVLGREGEEPVGVPILSAPAVQKDSPVAATKEATA